MNWEKAGTQLRKTVKELGLFNAESLRVIDIDKDKGIYGVSGFLKNGGPLDLQEIRFAADRWSETEAQAWCDEQKIGGEMIATMTELVFREYKIKETFDIDDKEVFRTGVWNGDPYTVNDLDEMVKAFSDLKEKRGVPLKLGHDDEQNILQNDGFPAAGWITKLKRVGDRLVASFKNVPAKIKEFIEAKAYHPVSSEIWWNYKDKETGKIYPRVLTAVALLGADIPAVSSLNDWGKFYTEKGQAEAIKTYTLKASEGKSTFTEDAMTPEQIEALKKENEALKKNLTDTEARAATAEQQAAAVAEQLKKHGEQKRQEDILVFVDSSIKEGKLLPKEKDQVIALMSSIDDTKVVKFSTDGKEVEMGARKLFETIVNGMAKRVDFSEKTGDVEGETGQTNKKDEATDRSQKLYGLAKKYESDHEKEKVTFREAVRIVSKEHPELVEAESK